MEINMIDFEYGMIALENAIAENMDLNITTTEQS